MDKIESQRICRQLSCHPPSGRLIRSKDVSSDEEEHCVLFDPLIIVETSHEGKMIKKWLGSARKRLGGDFPRVDAHKKTHQYRELIYTNTNKISDLSLMNNKKYMSSGKIEMKKASKEIMQNWIGLARTNKQKSMSNTGANIRHKLSKVLNTFSPENDFLYKAEFRIMGQALRNEGERISQERDAMKLKGKVELNQIHEEYSEFSKDIKKSLVEDRKIFETEIEKERSKVQEDTTEHLCELHQKLALLLSKSPNTIENHSTHHTNVKNTKELIEKERINSEDTKNNLEKEIIARSKLYENEELSSLNLLDLEKEKTVAKIEALKNEIDRNCSRSELMWQERAQEWITNSKRKMQQGVEVRGKACKRSRKIK
uniref:Uncharacterized protein n=2 Tax=Corethron hystrix TaxID=216773 RepID=A0A7S1G2L7_9STRA|mmetsp:Transcript_6786/g.14623  ORF Transcript_6786/g.14623 Transcript_6786/m.14623 type:complete len:371 (+) Transcript_6786:2462-3574(+)